VRTWTRSDGLVDDNVVALERAPDGAMWISTRVGLSRLDPQGRFENYTVADGLPSAGFNPEAVTWHRNRLYWGSTRGVVSIDPTRWRKRGSASPVVFTAIEGLDQKAALPQPPWHLRELRVPWNRPFSIEFAVLSFDGGEPEYEYRLHDNEAWVSLGNRGQLTLHSLPAGTYQVSVRARQSGATWTTTAPLSIEIFPPWWRTPWVQELAITLAFVALALAFFWRLHALQRRNLELQELQAQKDPALSEARESRDRLESAFGSLRRLTMQLETAKEEERKHLARELHDEFGQALTAAKINLRLAATNPGTALAEERNAETIALVDRLIGQVRALSFDLRPPLLDELGLGPALNAYLYGVAQRCTQRVDVDLQTLPSLGPMRDIAVFRIVQEAVTNCLRHAGDADIRVSLRPLDGGNEIEVRDHGAGFDAEALLASAPRGLGLLGMRERVEELGGRWSLQSRPGQGTTIQAFIPPETEPSECA
jgi:signal transduction histidine kinase